MLGAVTLGFALLGFATVIVVGFLFFGALANQKWILAAKCFAGLIVLSLVVAGAAQLGAPEWNKAIEARNTRNHVHVEPSRSATP